MDRDFEFKWRHDQDEKVLQTCTDKQERATRLFRISISFIVISVLSIGTWLALWILDVNENTTWLRNIIGSKSSRNRGKTFGPLLISTKDLWYSRNKKYALALLPDLHILSLSPSSHNSTTPILDPKSKSISIWSLGFTREILGCQPTLHFENGCLQLLNSLHFTVWTSELGSIILAKKKRNPSKHSNFNSN